MKILVINCGSSSLKFQLIDICQIEVKENLLAKGLIEKIGKPDSAFKCTTGIGDPYREERPIPDHKAAIQTAFDFLLGKGIIQNSAEIEGVGHRVVHGGEHFRESVLINEAVENAIQEFAELAPLHNPHNLAGYRAARELLPAVPQVAVFDTAFHHTIPERAYLYAIPYQYYEKDRIRRYGFHGTSHRYISQKFAQINRSNPRAWKLITCHLGNGCSISAVVRGRSLDTSMGFTPIEGLIMGTRSGDVDLGVILYLIKHHQFGPGELEEMLNKESGLIGISGISNDMRDLLRQRKARDKRAQLAVNMFCYHARKYIAAYMSVLRGAHAIIFAGGIGENSPEVRARICSGLRSFGVVLDRDLNKSALGIEREISSEESRTKVWVIPTNEELLIARDTVRCISKPRSGERM
jgi:acetate kinase